MAQVEVNKLTTNARGLEVDVLALFYGIKTHEIKNICGKREFSSMEVYLSGTRDQNGELLIEILFQALK